MRESRHLLIVGGGTMGVDIAASFAAFGWKTSIVNPQDSRFDSIGARFDAAMSRIGA